MSTMSEDEVSKQPGPPDDNPGGGQGPPDDFPGKGRGRDEVPGNAPFEDVKEKFEEIEESETGEGRFKARVLDENGDEKDRVETRRVNGPGSVEIRPFEENGKQKWGLKRKDKLPHNKNDNLGGDN